MEKLITYVDNTFSGVPQTPEIIELKTEVLNRMEVNYNELKNEGKSENEIIGIIISNFSDISERINNKLHENNIIYDSHPQIISDNYIKTDNSKIIKALLNHSVFWPLTVVIYLSMSFFFNIWGFSWMIFLVAVVVQRFFHSYYR